MLKAIAWAAVFAAGCLALPASAATVIYRFDVTVTAAVTDASPNGSFAAPRFTFYNLSDPGVVITQTRIFGGPPWDFINVAPGPRTVVNPAGGTRTLIEGEERTTDGNNGCTPGITYGFSGFDGGDSFGFSPDPEPGNCSSAVVDIQSFLDSDGMSAQVNFSGGVTLTGNSWVLEYIDPNASHSLLRNRLYRLGLQTSVTTDDPPPPPTGGVPEPGTWALMIGGFGMAGITLRNRRRRPA